MADDDEKSSGGIAENQGNLDDAQGGKNTALRQRAAGAEKSAQAQADRVNNAPANQQMLQRTPAGKTMRSTRWYDKSGP